MPDDVQFSKRILSPDEINTISNTFVNNFGFNKIRITGGEPTLRADFGQILTNFENQANLQDDSISKGITTNGLLINRYFDQLVSTNFTNINLSLDSLIPEKAAFISNSNIKTIQKIQKNLETLLIPAAEKNIIKLKINVVTMNNFNDDEIINFVKLAENYPIEVRFLEYMPFSGNKWEMQKVMSEQQILEKISDLDLIQEPPTSFNDVAKTYKNSNFKGKIGFISTITSPFCSGCNRVRITADGFMKNCLFSNNEVDLKPYLSDREKLIEVIQENIRRKKFSRNLEEISERPMVHIGG